MTSSQNSVLIVDSDCSYRDFLTNYFQKIGWTVNIAEDGQQAIKKIHRHLPDIVIMDAVLPIRDGISTCRLIKNDVALTRHFPIIIMSGSPSKEQVIKSIEAGSDDFIIKPFESEVLFKKVEILVKFYYGKHLKKEQDSLDIKRQEADNEIATYGKQVIEQAFSNSFRNKLIDYNTIHEVINKMTVILNKKHILPLAYKMKSHNDYIYVHSINVASISMAFAYHLKWSKSDMQTLGEGAFLHDIGMSKIDLQIYMKPEKLTDTEFSEIKKHPLYSRDILSKQNLTGNIQNAAIEHHERENGSGYPNKLRNKQISKHGKLVAIVDVYDALTTDRCYQESISSKEAVRTMAGMPGHFDSEYLKEFACLVNNETIGK